MKPIQFLTLFVLCVCLWACPYSSPYQLDDQPQQTIDDSLLGTWKTVISHHTDDVHTEKIPVTIIITKQTDSVYNVAVTGYLKRIKPFVYMHNDTLRGFAFLSTVANREVFNVLINGRIYLAELVKKESAISIYPMNEHFTNHMVRSNKAIRALLEYHFKTRLHPEYDDDFSITDLQRVNN